MINERDPIYGLNGLHFRQWDFTASHDILTVALNATAVTDKIIDEVKQWQQRPLESHYPLVWLDAIHYKVKDDGRYKTPCLVCLCNAHRLKAWISTTYIYRSLIGDTTLSLLTLTPRT